MESRVGYDNNFQGVTPSPNFHFSVSVSIPGSPLPNIGLTAVQLAAVSLLSKICVNVVIPNPYDIAAASANANDRILVPPMLRLANVGVAVVLKSCGLLIVTVVPLTPIVIPLLLANVRVPLFALIELVPVVPVTAIVVFALVWYVLRAVVNAVLVT